MVLAFYNEGLVNCRIAEHWDVVAPAPAEQRNPNSRPGRDGRLRSVQLP